MHCAPLGMHEPVQLKRYIFKFFWPIYGLALVTRALYPRATVALLVCLISYCNVFSFVVCHAHRDAASHSAGGVRFTLLSVGVVLACKTMLTILYHADHYGRSVRLISIPVLSGRRRLVLIQTRPLCARFMW